MDWGEFFFIQGGVLLIVAFGLLALHAGGYRHSKVAAAVDRNPVGHFLLMLMGMSRLRNQDQLEELVTPKFPTLLPALNKIGRGLLGFLGVFLLLVGAGFELAYLVELVSSSR